MSVQERPEPKIDLEIVEPSSESAALQELIAADPKVEDQLGGKSISDAARSQGVTIRTKDANGKPRTVALFAVRDGAPGLGAGHEVDVGAGAAHMFLRHLKAEVIRCGRLQIRHGTPSDP